MIKDEPGKHNENVCDLKYLSQMMGGKNHSIREIMDVFLTQVPEELRSMNDAVEKLDYKIIKGIAHTMKSTVSIMGIATLMPVLNKMESIGANAMNVDGHAREEIIELNRNLNRVCKRAIQQIERERSQYA